MNNLSEYAGQQEEQIEFLDFEAQEYGYEDITELFEDEPELFDILAREWREGHS